MSDHGRSVDVFKPYKALYDPKAVSLETHDFMRRVLFDANAIQQTQKNRSAGEAVLMVRFAYDNGLPVTAVAGNAYVVNGKISLYGEYPAALAVSAGVVEPGSWDYHFELDGERLESIPLAILKKKLSDWPDALTAVVQCRQRPSGAPVRETFSVAQARFARLLGKSGPWSEYPWDMLIAKARARLLKKYFPEALHGATIYEDILGTRAAREPDFVERRRERPKDQLTRLLTEETQNAGSETETGGPAEGPESDGGADRGADPGDGEGAEGDSAVPVPDGEGGGEDGPDADSVEHLTF